MGMVPFGRRGGTGGRDGGKGGVGKGKGVTGEWEHWGQTAGRTWGIRSRVALLREAKD